MGKLFDYLDRCRNRGLTESADGTVPISPSELKYLSDYLSRRGVQAVLVGSSAIVYHLKSSEHKFRPTYDVDLWYDGELPAAPPGWGRDMQSVGVESWVSPSGGTVDFLEAGQSFPNGVKVPYAVGWVPAEGGLKVAKLTDLLKMKLSSMRDKDIMDCVTIIRHLGCIPRDLADGRGLTEVQRENLQLVRQWFNVRPSGDYGA